MRCMKALKSLVVIFCAAVLSFAFCGDAFATEVKPAAKGLAGLRVPFKGTVTSITSGDHFTVKATDRSGKEWTFQCILWGVEASSPNAQKQLEILTSQKQFNIEWKDKNLKYQRTYLDQNLRVHPTYFIVRIWTTDSKKADIGEEMIKQGYASHLKSETKNDHMFDSKYDYAERQARGNPSKAD